MEHFDAIIIGARIAGCAAAIRLARAGKKVLLVDRSSTNNDVISTHFMNPRGLTYLHSLGVLKEILQSTPSFHYFDVSIDDYDLGGSLNEADLKQRMEKVHPEESFELVGKYSCIRRTKLDPLLQDLAVQQGVAVHFRATLKRVLYENKKVSGVELFEGGQKKIVSANLVIGADGRNSTVAEQIGAKKIEERQSSTFACYSYFQGLSLPHAIMKKRHRISFAAVPTNDNLTMVLVFGPSQFFADFKLDKPNNFFKAIYHVDPSFGKLIKEKGKQREAFRAVAHQSSFLRERTHSGAVLIGDAACTKDQCTAAGMTHALRDAFLLTSEITRTSSLENAIANFEDRRYLDSFRFYEFTASQAEMNPPRPEEEELYEATSASQPERDRFIGTYFDVYPVRSFFDSKRVEALLKKSRQNPRVRKSKDLKAIYQNPFSIKEPELPYEQNCVDFAQTFGTHLLQRTKPYYEFYKRRQDTCTFQYARTLHKFPGASTRLSDDSGRVIQGINFASQDYLGLGQDSEIREAVIKALTDFGPHSAGSPMIIGNTLLTKDLEIELKKLTGKKYILLFPTGYAAGMGAMLGLIKPQDHIVMDRLSHACLQQGARAATRNIYRYAHLSADAAASQLKAIRKKDVRNGILLVTEGLFSMDADSPDLRKFQEIASAHNATLFVDVAHDLGAMGPNGRGQVGLQGMYGKIDVVMGSFSKTFATNGGFVATDSESFIHYLRMYSTPHLFSNALSPLQTAAALCAAKIVQSNKGEILRNKLFHVVHTLRHRLKSHGLTCLGAPSPIVPVLIGSERNARRCHRAMVQNNLAMMILEYPVVPLGMSRYRLQVMSSHTVRQAHLAADKISAVMEHTTEETLHHPQFNENPIPFVTPTRKFS